MARSRTSPSIAIYNPDPGDTSYWEDDRPGKSAIYFNVHDDVWFVLANERDADSDLAGEAAAMRKLAETAAEVAGKLEQRYAAEFNAAHPHCRLTVTP